MKTLSDFEAIIKKSKRKNRLKVVVISTVTTLVSLGLLIKGLTEVTSKNGQSAADYYQTKTEIAFPNIYYSSAYYEPLSHFHGIFRSDRFKDLSGVRVKFEDYEVKYSLMGVQFPYNRITFDANSAYTRKDNLKVPVFYNTRLKNQQSKLPLDVRQDLALLPQMPNHAVEVAVTFDKPYTIAEIKRLLPKNLKAAWYWIGTSTEIDTSTFDLSEQIGFDLLEEVTLPASVADELDRQSAKNSDDYYKAYQKALKAAGPLTEEKNIHNNYTFFQKHAKKALEKNWLESSITDMNGVNWSLKEDVAAYLETYKDGNEAKFSGVILTGVSDDFAQIANEEWIFASSIGQSTPIMPYHQLSR